MGWAAGSRVIQGRLPWDLRDQRIMLRSESRKGGATADKVIRRPTTEAYPTHARVSCVSSIMEYSELDSRAVAAIRNLKSHVSFIGPSSKCGRGLTHISHRIKRWGMLTRPSTVVQRFEIWSWVVV